MIPTRKQLADLERAWGGGATIHVQISELDSLLAQRDELAQPCLCCREGGCSHGCRCQMAAEEGLEK